MSGFTWLNELMVWLGRWFPRIVLIKAAHEGVLFGPGGKVASIPPGLCVYWPIIQDLTVVSRRLRTLEIGGQLHGDEVIALVISYKIENPIFALTTLHDVHANLDDRAQSALADAMQEASRSNEQLAQILSAELHREFFAAGIAIASVDVVQRGRVVPLRVMKDWGTFEGRAL